MLVYRVDGSEINPAGCVDSADGPEGGGMLVYRVDGSEINSAGCVDRAIMVSIPKGGGMHLKHGPPPFPLFPLSPSPFGFFLPQIKLGEGIASSVLCSCFHLHSGSSCCQPVGRDTSTHQWTLCSTWRLHIMRIRWKVWFTS